jgi:hypothetical protein
MAAIPFSRARFAVGTGLTWVALIVLAVWDIWAFVRLALV